MRIAIVSGKGGSGKSSVTAAFVALSSGVVAVDCDVDASNLPLLFDHEVTAREPFASGCRIDIDRRQCVQCGRCVRSCEFHALQHSDNGIQAVPFLCEGCGLCVRICPRHAITLTETADSVIYTSRFAHGQLVHGTLSPGDGNSGKMIARIRAVADTLLPHDDTALQLLDGPPGIGCPVLSTLTGVDKVVIVAEATLSGLADMQRIYNVAHSFCNDIAVIINKSDMYAAGSNAINDFCMQHDIAVVARLPFDRQIVEAQLQRTTIVDYAPLSPISRELKKAFEVIRMRS